MKPANVKIASYLLHNVNNNGAGQIKQELKLKFIFRGLINFGRQLLSYYIQQNVYRQCKVMSFLSYH